MANQASAPSGSGLRQLLLATAQRGEQLAQLRHLRFHRPHTISGRINALRADFLVQVLAADRVALHDFDHALGYLGLELAAHVQHGLRTLLVQLLDRRPACLLHSFAQKLLQLAILLFRRVAGKVQRNDLVWGRLRSRHGHRFLRAKAHWSLQDSSAERPITLVRRGEDPTSAIDPRQSWRAGKGAGGPDRNSIAKMED
jgi:hypothetical protein